MLFPMADIALDLGNVFFFLSRKDIDTCGRRVGAMTLFPSSMVPGTLLIVMVLLMSLALIGLALMGGPFTRHISKGKISGLSSSKVLLLLFSRLFLLGTP